VVFVFSKKRIDALADNLQVSGLTCLPCCRLPAACSCPGRQPAGKARLNCCFLLLPPALAPLMSLMLCCWGLALPCLITLSIRPFLPARLPARLPACVQSLDLVHWDGL
jgi:hypothetical protein